MQVLREKKNPWRIPNGTQYECKQYSANTQQCHLSQHWLTKSSCCAVNFIKWKKRSLHSSKCIFPVLQWKKQRNCSENLFFHLICINFLSLEECSSIYIQTISLLFQNMPCCKASYIQLSESKKVEVKTQTMNFNLVLYNHYAIIFWQYYSSFNCVLKKKKKLNGRPDLLKFYSNAQTLMNSVKTEFLGTGHRAMLLWEITSLNRTVSLSLDSLLQASPQQLPQLDSETSQRAEFIPFSWPVALHSHSSLCIIIPSLFINPSTCILMTSVRYKGLA